VAADLAPSWELAPYRIRVLVAVEPGACVPRRLAEELAADLPARASATIGGAWELEAAVAPEDVRHAVIHGLADLTADRLPVEAMSKDKVLLLAIAASEAGVRIRAREFDVNMGLWNSVVTSEAAEPEELAGAAWRAVLAAFAPLARIDAIEQGSATLRLKAGGIARRDRSLAVVPAGAAFRPVLVTLDEAGRPEPKSAQPIDWTFLTATGGAGPIVTCRIDTGAASEPLPAYHPRRMRLALGVAPSGESTRLVLVSRGTSRAPLEGIEVLAADAGATSEVRGASLGMSDFSGVVFVPPGATAVRMLDIRQGSQTLARVPIVPGLATEVQLALADNRERLEIDAALAEAEDSLVDLAARRQALAARIKLGRKSGDAAVDGLLPKLRALANVEPQQSLVNKAEKLISSADASTQSALQPRLEALKKTTQSLATQSPTSLLEEPKPAATNPETPNAAVEKKPGEAKQ
jgi:hypothetical protein